MTSSVDVVVCTGGGLVKLAWPPFPKQVLESRPLSSHDDSFEVGLPEVNRVNGDLGCEALQRQRAPEKDCTWSTTGGPLPSQDAQSERRMGSASGSWTSKINKILRELLIKVFAGIFCVWCFFLAGEEGTEYIALIYFIIMTDHRPKQGHFIISQKCPQMLVSKQFFKYLL